MSRPANALIYVATMVAVILGVDLAFVRHQLWPRLAVNIAIVLVFAAVYVRFGGRPWSRRK